MWRTNHFGTTPLSTAHAGHWLWFLRCWCYSWAHSPMSAPAALSLTCARWNAVAVIETSDMILTRSVDAETGQRAYLMTGDEVFLEPYRGAAADINRWLDSLRVLVRDDSAQDERLARIATLLPERFALLASGIAQKQRRSPQATGEVRLLLENRRWMRCEESLPRCNPGARQTGKAAPR